MRANDAQHPTGDVQFRHQCATRLQAGQGDPADLAHLRIADQDQVSMPAVRGTWTDRNGHQPMFHPKQIEVQQARSRAEPRVDLLQRDDVGTDLPDHLERAREVAATVSAHSLVDVPRRDDQLIRHCCPPSEDRPDHRQRVVPQPCRPGPFCYSLNGYSAATAQGTASAARASPLSPLHHRSGCCFRSSDRSCAGPCWQSLSALRRRPPLWIWCAAILS